jgi:hypothetical protein
MDQARWGVGNFPSEGERKVLLWEGDRVDAMAYGASVYLSNPRPGTGCAMIARR